MASIPLTQHQATANSATRELKQLLSDNHNACFQQYIQNLSPTASTDYSLWKAVRKSKHITPPSPPLQTAQGTWARTNTGKAQTLANHLASVFQPNPSNNSPEEEEPIISLLESPYQLEPPPQRFKQSEIQTRQQPFPQNFTSLRSHHRQNPTTTTSCSHQIHHSTF
jgi:hypothetical protein